MDKKLVVFYGHKGSGKDTCFDLFHSAMFFKHRKNAQKLSFAETLRNSIWSILKSKIKDKERIYGDIDKKEEIIDDWEIDETIKKTHNCFTDEEKYWTGRRLLQFFGTEVYRGVYKDVWIDCFASELEDKMSLFDVFGVTDCRFMNEYDKIKSFEKDFDVFFVKVTRPVADNGYSTHESERYIDSFEYNYEIENNGTLDELKQKISVLLDKIYE
jgi:hypothetical protein